MKMNAWVAVSAANLRLSQSSLRMRLYRGVIPMPRRAITNQRVMDVLDPPLSPLSPLSSVPCGVMPQGSGCASNTSRGKASSSSTSTPTATA